jgi:hypothetical protein
VGKLFCQGMIFNVMRVFLIFMLVFFVLYVHIPKIYNVKKYIM